MANIRLETSSESLNQREREVLTLLSDGLTNQEIAQALFLSLDTVKWYNRRIFTKLEVANRTQAIKKAREAGLTLDQVALPRTAPHAPKYNLPAAIDSFIGREDALAQLKTYLAMRRLVTLSGPGGVGKTRLALQAGWELREVFADGVCLVNLAATREASLVLNAIAAALGLNEIPGQGMADRLRDHLAEKEMLLILDNFEQVLGAGPQVYSLLAYSPNLRILVTSREILHLSGEQVFSLGPLPFADSYAGLQEGGKSQASDAVQLFEQRAQAVKPDFRLSEKNAPVVLEICRRLEGLPLAIELAAVRLRVLNPNTILAQLDHRLRLLVGGARNLPRRQQTMRASIEWSYELLTPAEQALFQRLAVFAGGCTLEAAESVCGGDVPNMLEGIESLLDKHLLFNRDVNGETRFAMFETLREFALERLEASCQSSEVCQRYAGYYAGLRVRFFNQINRLEPEIDNFRAVLRWAIDTGQVEPGMQIIMLPWLWTQWNSEYLFWMESLLNSPAAQAPSPLRLEGLFHAVFQALMQEDLERCRIRLDEYEALTRTLGNQEPKCPALYFRGYIQIMQQDYEAATITFNQGLKLSEALEQAMWVAFSHAGLGYSRLLSGQSDQAEVCLQMALQLLTDQAFLVGRIEILTSLGYTALEKADLQSARTLFRQSLQEGSALGLKAEYADSLNGLASIAQKQGGSRQAARLYSAVQAQAEKAGLLSHAPALKILNRRYLAALRQQMEPNDLERAWQEGQAMSLDEAIMAGLAVEPHSIVNNFIKEGNDKIVGF